MSAPVTPEQRNRLLQLATRASVATALVLIAGKLVAWLMTGSVSVLASDDVSSITVGTEVFVLVPAAVTVPLSPRSVT
mgnify:CR=1 FL=1